MINVVHMMLMSMCVINRSCVLHIYSGCLGISAAKSDSLLHRPLREAGVISVARCFFILRPFHCEEVFQLPLECFKCWPFHWVFMPAFQHYIIQSSWTTGRHWHSITVLNLMQYFSISHSCNKLNH